MKKTFMFSKIFSIAWIIVVSFSASYGASINFGREPLHMGKQLFAEDSYYVNRSLGVARFTPEAEIPFLLSYKSNRKERGIFGSGWYSPLLESRLGGDMWDTPWGEKIKLPDARFQKEDRLICGRNEYSGWEFLYLFGRLQKIITPSRREISFIYDNPGGMISAVRIGNSNFIRIIAQDNLVSKLIIGGVTTSFVYQRGLLKEICPADIAPESFHYDDRKRLIQIRRKDFTDKIQIGADGRIVSDADYDYFGKIFDIAIRDRIGVKQSLRMHKNTLIHELAGREMKVEYMPLFDASYPHHPVKVAVGARTLLRIDYDDGRPTKITDRFGNQRIMEYDKAGNPVKFSERKRSSASTVVRETAEYDRWRKPVKRTVFNADGSIRSETAFFYDDHRQLVKMENDGKTICFQYTSCGFPAAVGTDKGWAYRFAYDEYNRKTVDGKLLTSQFAYNQAGLPAQFKTASADGGYTAGGTIAYDAYGRPVSLKLTDGRTERYERDCRGRILKHHRFDGSTIAYQYDPAGNLCKVTDPNGNSICAEYRDGLLFRRITPEEQVTEYACNEFGEKISEKMFFAARPDAPDLTMNYRYTPEGLISAVDYGNGYLQEMRYNDNGKLSSVTRTSPTEKRIATLKYDPDDRVIRREEKVFPISGKKVEYLYTYEFDEKGRRSRFSFADGDAERSIDYSYDDEGRLESITAGNDKVEFTYKNGLLFQETVNGQPFTYKFDSLGRLIGKKFGKRELKYFWRKDGNLAAREFAGKRRNFRHDKLGQLVSVTGPNKKIVESYTYDPAGNILRQTVNGVASEFSYDRANQLVTGKIGDRNYRYRYDAAGRMVADGHSVWQYGWRNSVVKCGDTAYSYDTAGQLASAGEETFFWDELALIERNGDPVLCVPAPTGGNPVLAGGSIIFHDMLGSSVGAWKDGKFTALPRSAFGLGEAAPKADFHTGKPYVAGLGHNFLLRNYDARSGRWTNADPLGYPDGWNNHIYCTDNPILSTDKIGGKMSYDQAAFFGDFSLEVAKKVSYGSSLSKIFSAGSTAMSGLSVLAAAHDGYSRNGAMGALQSSILSSGLVIVSESYPLVGLSLGAVNAFAPEFSEEYSKNFWGVVDNVGDFFNSGWNTLFDFFDSSEEFDAEFRAMQKKIAEAKKRAREDAEELAQDLQSIENYEPVRDDVPAATLRAFFVAIAKGNMPLAESFIEPSNLPTARWWITEVCMQHNTVWIGPVSYVWGNGKMAAVDFKLGDRPRTNVLLIKTGVIWKIRFSNLGDQYATKIPEAIMDRNTKAGMVITGRVKAGRWNVPFMEFRPEYIVKLK